MELVAEYRRVRMLASKDQLLHYNRNGYTTPHPPPGAGDGLSPERL
jgi:hypothetical protein